MDLKPGKKWECPKCSKTFKTNSKLTAHMVTHEPDAKVKCEVCGIISKNRHALSCHIWRRHSNRKTQSCGTCHREFCSLASLTRHVDALHSTVDRSRALCTFPGCQKSYKDMSDLVRHVKREHAENPVRFPCTLCGKDFKWRAHLERHIATHTTEKTYNCATCGRSFANKLDMKDHEETHLEKSTRERLQCHLCPQTFLRRTDLHRHIRVVHENQRNYLCAFCDKRFSTSGNLKGHMEAMHVANKELTHSCDQCEYKSHSKVNLAAHRKRHYAGRHECYFCGKNFITFYQLVSHCRAHTLEKLK